MHGYFVMNIETYRDKQQGTVIFTLNKKKSG